MRKLLRLLLHPRLALRLHSLVLALALKHLLARLVFAIRPHAPTSAPSPAAPSPEASSLAVAPASFACPAAAAAPACPAAAAALVSSPECPCLWRAASTIIIAPAAGIAPAIAPTAAIALGAAPAACTLIRVVPALPTSFWR